MRERLTWKRGGALNAPPRRASAHPAYPDEGAASPAYQPDPEADAYENGDPSSWAEDPHPGPYPQSAHPAYPDEGPASPAYIAKQGSVALALERKAAKCVRLASAMLGPGASQHEVENQAFAFMDMSERALQASLSRLAQQGDGEGAEDDAEAEEQQAKKEATLRRRAQAKKDEEEEQQAEKEEQQEVKGGKKAALAKAAYLRRLAQQIEEEVEEEVEEEDESEDESEDEDEGKDAKKKASLNARLARIERLLTAGLPGMHMQHNMAQQKSPEEMMLEAMLGEEQQGGMSDEAQSLEEMMLEAMQQEAQQAPKPFGMMAEQLAMQGDMAGPLVPEAMQGMKAQHGMKAQQVEAQLAEMLQEEGMGEVLGAEYADEAEAMLVDPSGDDYVGADGMLVDPSGDNYDDGMMSDPMGLMGDGGNEDDAILASLFGDAESMKYAKKGQQDKADAEAQEEEQQAEEPKKGQQKAAALRPQPRKASTGATRLGGITKEAAEVSDLSKLWESAPDVSKYF